MTTSHTERPSPRPSEGLDFLAGWLTLAVVLIILGITLFPFRFSETASSRVGFFLFWFAPLKKHWMGWFLNIVLFLPFGFGLAWWTRVRGWKWLSRPIAIGAAGFLFSYAVEFVQLFVVRRNSSWDDVLMNTAGALAGQWLFERWGARLVRWAEAVFLGVVSASER